MPANDKTKIILSGFDSPESAQQFMECINLRLITVGFITVDEVLNLYHFGKADSAFCRQFDGMGWKSMEGIDMRLTGKSNKKNFSSIIFPSPVNISEADITKLIPKYAPKRKSKLREDVEIVLWTLGAVAFALLWLFFMWWLAVNAL